MKLLMKKIASYAIDYAITMSFVGIFTFCANVFSLEEATKSKSMLMLICAFIVVIYLTTYLPTQTNGQTIGQKIMKLRVVNRNGKPRTYFQNFLRECVAKISAAPFFVLFTIIYGVVYAIGNKTTDVELPLDFILKTEMIETGMHQ